MFIKIKDIIKVIFVVLFFNTLLVGQSVLSSPNYKILNQEYELIAVVFILFLLVASTGYVLINREAINDILLIIGPFIFTFIVSIIEILLERNITLDWTIHQHLYPFLSFACAYPIIKVFDKKAIDYITYACLANYTIYVYLYLKAYGLFGIINFIAISESHGYKNYLEVHEVTFMMGLLLVYYCFDSFKKNWLKILWLALYVFLGYKRILFPAIAVGFVAGLIIIYRNRKAVVMALSSISFAVVTFWLFFVNSKYYELVAATLGIELNGRDFSSSFGLYGRIAGYYTLSPFYIGSGVGFVQKVMNNYAEVTGSSVYGLHNDVLKYYIDLGFIPFFIFLIIRVFIIPNAMCGKRSGKSIAIYVSTLMITLVCWTTDNLASYPNYLFISTILIAFSVIGKEKEEVRSIQQ